MPQSLSKVNVHIVFSTKHNEQSINPEIRKDLQSYIIGILSNIGSYTEELYANTDHLHILCTLPRTITIAQLISKIKTPTSSWLKTQGVHNFCWQEGYAIFSVSASKIKTVKAYILNQYEHHKKQTFKDELRLFFSTYKIEFNEQYVWD